MAALAPSPSSLYSPSIIPGKRERDVLPSPSIKKRSIDHLSFSRTRLGVDAKRPGGERQFSGIMDVYVKTIKADGLMGLYRGFGISCTCIFIYRGLYFGLFDSLKPLGNNLSLMIW